jgi:drug/metabolite transporter (DMT)-like permease
MEKGRRATPAAEQVGIRMSRTIGGLGLVALAAALWGTDGVLRGSLSLELPPATIVFWEHVILVVLTFPVLMRALAASRSFGVREWVSIIVIGAGASATATALFTAAFSYGDFTAPLLLQKLQPLLAIVAARVLLGERARSRFLWFLAAGLAGAWLIAFPDPGTVSVSAAAPALLASGAAALWGMGTVLGRHMTGVLAPDQVTALRFGIGLPASGLLALFIGGTESVPVALGDMGKLVLLALIPGLIALRIYYRGLRTTPASLATLAELAFPISAVTLNYLVFGTTLSDSQWSGVLVLSATLVAMSITGRRAGTEALGVETPAEPAGLLAHQSPS